uniref:coiled-coil domain-containing protein 60 n=1 Tax=Panthera onca TaxID=9690 RepID=UPI002954E90F|nr:coiled-coil domain-containing protein 60 [Panthera onca]
MTKIPATKKVQSVPNAGALWPFYASEHLTQVPDKPMKSIKYMDKEIINLKKDLARSRMLIRLVKTGRGYFSMLQEESALKKKQQYLQKLKEEERHKFQPAKKISEVHYGDILLTTYDQAKVRKMGAGVVLRPFTPVHSCIISSSLPEAHVEPLFRQLCALHWLLEALTIDHAHHTMKPVITCWNPNTPDLQKLLEMVREDARRTVIMENGMHKKAPSILSMLKQTKSDSAYKDVQTTRKSSERSSSTSGESHTLLIQKKSKSRTNRDIIQCKSGVCNTMRAKFYSVAQEAGFCLQDKMEILMKRQEERGLQKFHSFVFVSDFKKDIAKMRHQVSMIKGDAEEIADHWYFDLLSKLPKDLKNFRPAKKILAKLQKFGENLDLRIRPHVLLKVLQDLRIWELCSPDIAVAIEFVREHIIHMSQEDYINWLQTRINIPIRSHSLRT